ncbi:MAG: xanthine dehydrogenase subunit D, partial [Actinomycetota bacterium]|nr:xanthine dehydrogenase subunit D [Actinomycetota bacterium]
MTRAQVTPTPTRVGPGPTTFSPGGIGESVRRPDGVPKVTGEFEFSSDMSLDGMLWGATLRSPHPSARIWLVDTSEAEEMPGVHA